jgi:gamma-glutamylcyclotransferase (GGCT)/AIG2-like uncharacterized protein YtfP
VLNDKFMNNDSIHAFFVYGTLKRNHLRSGLWPKKPVCVYPATVAGDLFDLGPYPAACDGNGTILGEVWEIHPGDMRETCTVLDRIEGYDPSGNSNEYIRVAVHATIVDESGQSIAIAAWMYHAAAPERLKLARKISATQHFYGRFVASWPDSLSRVPSSFAEE